MADTPNNITKLLTALCSPIQDLENALQQLLTERTIATAFGAQLDVLGKIVGQARGGLVDADYRRYIHARVIANRSDGVPEDLIAIASLVLNITTTGTILLRCIEDATLILEIRDHAVDVPTATALQQLLTIATSGGVRVVIVYSAVPLAQTFRFDVGPGFDVGQFARGIDGTGTP